MKKLTLLMLLIVVPLYAQANEDEKKSEKERTILKLVKEGKMSVEEAEILLKDEKKSETKFSKVRYSFLIQGGAGSYNLGGGSSSESSSDSSLILLPLLLSSSSSSSSSSGSSSLGLLLPLLLSGNSSGDSLLPLLLFSGGGGGSLLPILLLSSSSEPEKATITTSHGGVSMNVLPTQGHSFQAGVSYGTAANSGGQSGWSTLDLGYTYFFRDGQTFVPFLGIGIGGGSTTGGGGGAQATVGKAYLETGFRVYFTESAFTSLTLKGEYLNFSFKGANVESSGGNAQLGFGLMF